MARATAGLCQDLIASPLSQASVVKSRQLLLLKTRLAHSSRVIPARLSKSLMGRSSLVMQPLADPQGISGLDQVNCPRTLESIGRKPTEGMLQGTSTLRKPGGATSGFQQLDDMTVLPQGSGRPSLCRTRPRAGDDDLGIAPASKNSRPFVLCNVLIQLL